MGNDIVDMPFQGNQDVDSSQSSGALAWGVMKWVLAHLIIGTVIIMINNNNSNVSKYLSGAFSVKTVNRTFGLRF